MRELLEDMENEWRDRIGRFWVNLGSGRQRALELRRGHVFQELSDGLTVDTSPDSPASEMILVCARIIIPDNERFARQIKRLYFWITATGRFTALAQKAMYIAYGSE